MKFLTPAEEKWVDYVRAHVAPHVGARPAALVTWWALKEGVLDVQPNPWRHNICSHPGASNVKLGDLDVCQGSTWQLGMSGIQGNAVSEEQVEKAAARLYPGTDITTLLLRIASDAGISDDSTTQAIVQSDGVLRKAWLLRDPVISFSLQAPFVEAGCLQSDHTWCYGGWQTAVEYADSRERALEVITELEDSFNGVATPSRPAWLPFVAVALVVGGAYFLVTPARMRRVLG